MYVLQAKEPDSGAKIRIPGHKIQYGRLNGCQNGDFL